MAGGVSVQCCSVVSDPPLDALVAGVRGVFRLAMRVKYGLPSVMMRIIAGSSGRGLGLASWSSSHCGMVRGLAVGVIGLLGLSVRHYINNPFID